MEKKTLQKTKNIPFLCCGKHSLLANRASHNVYLRQVEMTLFLLKGPVCKIQDM